MILLPGLVQVKKYLGSRKIKRGRGSKGLEVLHGFDKFH